MKPMTVKAGESFALPVGDFYKEPIDAKHVYMFKGWNLGAFGETIEINQNTELIAQWELIDLNDQAQADKVAFVTFFETGSKERIAGYVYPKGIRYTLKSPKVEIAKGYRLNWVRDDLLTKLYTEGNVFNDLRSMNLRKWETAEATGEMVELKSLEIGESVVMPLNNFRLNNYNLSVEEVFETVIPYRFNVLEQTETDTRLVINEPLLASYYKEPSYNTAHLISRSFGTKCNSETCPLKFEEYPVSKNFLNNSKTLDIFGEYGYDVSDVTFLTKKECENLPEDVLKGVRFGVPTRHHREDFPGYFSKSLYINPYSSRRGDVWAVKIENGKTKIIRAGVYYVNRWRIVITVPNTLKLSK